MSFWTGNLSKTAETCDEWFTFATPIFFFLNVYFHDFSVKITQFCMEDKTNHEGRQKVVSPVLNRVAKWAIFVLNRVGVWRPPRHNSTQTSLECPPGISLVAVNFWHVMQCIEQTLPEASSSTKQWSRKRPTSKLNKDLRESNDGFCIVHQRP